MLLDDPLSAVDAAVSRHLFDRYVVTQVVYLSSVWCIHYTIGTGCI